MPQNAFKLPLKSFTLKNGLVVVVQTDKTVPVVAVSITYKVGSQDEKPGRSGFAHLFEHLMFQGTKNLKPNEIARLIEGSGGVNNAYTMKTNTTYHEIVPRSALSAVLWAEADRMTGLLVDERSLAVEKQVVMEEKRQSELNKPYRRAMDEVLASAAFQKWSNRHTTIGEMKDIQGAHLGDVRDFYRTHYAPNNAVMALAGDIDLAEAKKLVTRYFAKIPRRKIPKTPDLSERALQGETLTPISDPFAKVPLAVMSWHVPKRGSKDFWALFLLMKMLSNSEDSPLYQALVKKTKIALSAQGYLPHWSSHYNMKGPDVFSISVSAKNGVTARQVAAEVDKLLARLAERGPTEDELARAKAETEREWLDDLQFLMDRAQLLSSYAALIGKPEKMADDLRRVARITGRDVQNAVKKRMIASGRVLLDVQPGKPARAGTADAGHAIPPEAPRAPGEIPPPLDADLPVPIPEINRFTLSNGLHVVFIHDDRLPMLEMRLSLKASPADEGPGQDGLSLAMESLLFKGTEQKTGEEIAAQISRLGFEVSTASDSQYLKVSMAGLARNAKPLLSLIAEVLRGASYPESETELWKENMEQELQAMRADPSFLSDERLKAELFPNHPFGRGTPNEKDIAATTSARLREFHAQAVRPGPAKLVIVGSLDKSAAQSLLEESLGTWSGASAVPAPLTMPGNRPARVSLIKRPGSHQASVTVAQTTAVFPKHPDWLAFMVMNHLLGGTENSRLFENLRAEKGYTYGSYSGVEAYGCGAVWSAHAEVRNEVLAPAIDEIHKEVRRMREVPVAAETLETAKRYLSGIFLLRMSALNRTANYVSALTEDGRDPAIEMASFQERLAAVTVERVHEAARRYLDPERMVTIVVGDESALKFFSRGR